MTVFSNEKRNHEIYMKSFKIPAEHKKFVLIACFLLIFIFIAADCFAQSQNNDQQRLVGTWVSLEDPEYSFIFRSNMSYSVIEYGEVFDSGKWRINASRNIMIITDSENEEYECQYLLSNDGRTLAIIEIFDPEDYYIEVFRKKE